MNWHISVLAREYSLGGFACSDGGVHHGRAQALTHIWRIHYLTWSPWESRNHPSADGNVIPAPLRSLDLKKKKKPTVDSHTLYCYILYSFYAFRAVCCSMATNGLYYVMGASDRGRRSMYCTERSSSESQSPRQCSYLYGHCKNCSFYCRESGGNSRHTNSVCVCVRVDKSCDIGKATPVFWVCVKLCFCCFSLLSHWATACATRTPWALILGTAASNACKISRSFYIS